MNIDLTGKTALVSGSTAGIGLAIAEGLAAAGANVVVNGRTAERTRAAVATVETAAGAGKVSGFAADVATRQGCDALLEQLPSIDILVNNAGTYALKHFFAITDEDWEQIYAMNVLSGVRLSRALMPAMLDRDWGRIVFIASESGLHIPKEMIHYGMTKTAQLAISRGLAELTAGTGVTVNAVLPGPTRSEGVDAMLTSLSTKTGRTFEQVAAEFIAQERPSSLLGRLAEVEEVANMVVYACSPQASATNGAALRVDGGVVRSIA